MDINVVTLEQALSVLGQLLEDRELYYEIVVIEDFIAAAH